MDEKFRIEVRFYKNRHYPDFGSNAYSLEGYSIYFPYGKKHHFKTSKSAVEFVKSRINEEALNTYDEIIITIWRGYGGICEYLKKNDSIKNDTHPINKEFADKLLNINTL